MFVIIREHYGTLSDDLRIPILERDKYTCRDCGHQGQPKDHSLHVHHIFPYRLGGEHVPGNLVTLCALCHQKRDRKYRVLCMRIWHTQKQRARELGLKPHRYQRLAVRSLIRMGNMARQRDENLLNWLLFYEN